jgi:hypothetical protein
VATNFVPKKKNALMEFAVNSCEIGLAASHGWVGPERAAASSCLAKRTSAIFELSSQRRFTEKRAKETSYVSVTNRNLP